jgi:hypothetical protein
MLPLGVPPVEEMEAVRVTAAPALVGFGVAVNTRLAAAGGTAWNAGTALELHVTRNQFAVAI